MARKVAKRNSATQKVKMEPNSGVRPIKKQEATNIYNTVFERELLDRQMADAAIENFSGQLYEGIDPRRRIEYANGGMIKQDYTDFANCPRQAIHHEYPAIGFNYNPYMSALRKKKEF